MSKIPTLGRLERVDPEQVWSHEAHSFTPWLALAENLEQLGETLGIDLELEAVEQAVGPFRADILCKQVGTGRWVLIENQLQKTDHPHLGQVLTDAAGLDAVTVIWISPQVTDEHRACLDWLSRCTIEGLHCFGVQLEVWRIGESQLAPRFNIVSKPNQWTKSVSEGTASLGQPETRQTHLDYWAAFREAVSARDGPLKAPKPSAQNWQSISPFNKGDVNLNFATNRLHNRIKAELYIKGRQPHAWFLALKERQADIEARLGPTVWKESASKDRTITQFLESVDPTDRDDWPRQHAWLVDRLYTMHSCFAPILATLQPANLEDFL